MGKQLVDGALSVKEYLHIDASEHEHPGEHSTGTADADEGVWLPDLDRLTGVVRRRAGGDPLEAVAAALDVAAVLRRVGDRLVGRAVEDARASGRSWSDIGHRLGTTRQAAQQRLGARAAGLTIADLLGSGNLVRATPRARSALEAAEREAVRAGAGAVEPGHLLAALAGQRGTVAAAALDRAGAARRAVVAAGLAVASTGTGGATPAGGHAEPPPVGPGLRRCLEAALDSAVRMGHNYVGGEHLLLGCLADPALAAAVEAATGMTPTAAAAAVAASLDEVLRRRA